MSSDRKPGQSHGPDLLEAAAQTVAEEIRKDGGQAFAFLADALDKKSLERVCEEVVKKFGRVDMLINGAGGNKPQATTSPDLSFFDLPQDAFRWVFDLNFTCTLLASQVFGKIMAKQKDGIVLNVSSMNYFRPLTRVPAYSAAKAAVSNFTQWLAVHFSQTYSPKIRVNAIAPGFFLTEQIGSPPKRDRQLDRPGKSIIDPTPMNRFGDPEDLVGAVLWLLSPASEFVHGAVIPIDGGFSAFSGVNNTPEYTENTENLKENLKMKSKESQVFFLDFLYFPILCVLCPLWKMEEK
jgi:NAD(P)-dependent dehydrogenase (short-subunit alcohol dehydrogenase family)